VLASTTFLSRSLLGVLPISAFFSMGRMWRALLAARNALPTACRFPMVDVAALLVFFRLWMEQTALGAHREGLVSLVRKAAKIVLYVRMASTGHPLILLPRSVFLVLLAPTAPRMLHFIHFLSSMVSGGFPTLPLSCCLAPTGEMRFVSVEVTLGRARQLSQGRFAKCALVPINISWMESASIVQM